MTPNKYQLLTLRVPNLLVTKNSDTFPGPQKHFSGTCRKSAMHYAHQIDVQRTAPLAYAVASEFASLGADLQNILRFIVRLS